MGTRKHRIIICTLESLSLAIVSLLVSCSKEATESSVSPPLSVRVIRVEPQPLETALDVTGSLVSTVAVEVRTEFPGRLVSMTKEEGDRVGKGEGLAQLDDVQAGLVLGQARAALEVSEAAHSRAQVAQEHAINEFQRAQNLLKSGGITEQDFQAAVTAQKDAGAQVRLAGAQVAQAREAVAIAEKHLHDCRILSPISGEIDKRFVNPGGWLDGSALLYRLVDNQRLELEAYVVSSDLGAVKKGQTVRFQVAAYGGEEFGAKITHISAGVDVLNRSSQIRAAVPNPDGRLKAGLFVKGRIVTGIEPNAIVVPHDAVWRRAGQTPFVFVVENHRSEKRDVKLGREGSYGIQISEGLKSGETLVLEQNLELADGVAVTPQS